MRLSIKLYSTNGNVVSADILRSCLGLLGSSKFRVSRTIGPANYFEVERRYLETGISNFPPKDIDDQAFSSVEEVCSLIRPESVLRVSIGSDSEQWARLSRGISDFSEGTSGFFSSTAGFSFGPLDICNYFEDETGQDDVKLVDVAQVCFFLTSDNFVGDWTALLKSLEEAEPLVTFRSDLERIVGPVKLHVSA